MRHMQEDGSMFHVSTDAPLAWIHHLKVKLTGKLIKLDDVCNIK